MNQPITRQTRPLQPDRRFDVVVSQGRVADRSKGAIAGAALAASAIEQLARVTARQVGKLAPPASDDWSVSLPQAHDTLTAIGRVVGETLAGERTPVLVANTCSASLASLPLAARAHPEAVVLWVDAHGDFNTPSTTTTGYLGGMVLAAACGLWLSGHGAGLRPEQVVIVGGRDFDPAEAEALKSAGVRVIAPEAVTPEAVLDAVGGAPVWLHVDWDSLEPGFVPAAYKVPGGLTPGQLREVLASLPRDRVKGIELAEFEATGDPQIDAAAVAQLRWIVEPLFEG